MQNAQESDSFDVRLRAALGHPIPETAAMAARVLANRRCFDAIPDLIVSSRSDEPERAEAATAALAVFDDRRARERLQEIARTGTARCRDMARHALRAEHV